MLLMSLRNHLCHLMAQVVTNCANTFELCDVVTRKLRKESSELADKMESLTLEEKSPNDSKSSTEQMLLQLEDVFSFPTADSSTFPESHCREFTQLTRHIPQGKRFHNALISKKLLKCFVSLGRMSLIPLNRTELGWVGSVTALV